MRDSSKFMSEESDQHRAAARQPAKAVPIWERPEFAGLNPDERDQLATAGATVRDYLRWRNGRDGGQPMFRHEFLDAFRQSRTVARAAAERGVTVQQLADALQVSTQLATLLMTGSQPPTTAEPPARPT